MKISMTGLKLYKDTIFKLIISKGIILQNRSKSMVLILCTSSDRRIFVPSFIKISLTALKLCSGQDFH